MIGRSARGFSLVELLLAMSLLVTIAGAAFGMLATGEDRLAVEPEAADMQQRLRVAVTMLHHDLVQAGAGTAAGARPGPLTNHIAAILPYRQDPRDGDAPGSFREDAITILYVPRTTAQSTLAQPLPARPGWARLNNDAGCPRADPACGFAVGMAVLVFDAAGSADRFTVSDVQGDELALVHDGPDSDHVYATGSTIAEVVARTYFLEADEASGARRLMRGRANGGADVPVADHVVALMFDYGLPPATFVDGPWLPDATSPQRFDANLLQIRKVDIKLRVQSAVRALRGPAGVLFTASGTSRSGRRWLPDAEVRFSVRPRNINPEG